MTMILCLLAIVSAIPWSGAIVDNPAFRFNCTGDYNVAIINASFKQSLQGICGDNVHIEYDPTKDAGNTLGSSSNLRILFSSSSHAGDSSQVELFNFSIGIITSKWHPVGIDVEKIFNKQLCGTGYIFAEIVDNDKVIAGAESRAVMICDNSDIDVALDVNFNIQSISIPTDSFSDVIQYLKENGIVGRLQLSMVRGSLPSVTNETLHWLFMYLRQPYSAKFYKGNCDVPDYKLGDVILGTANFSRGIDAAGQLDLLPLLNGKPIDITPRMCGHMELVIMFDALKTDFDGDECNNFKVIDVNVECTDLPPTMPSDMMCHVVSNPIASNQVWAKYDDRVYSYEVGDRIWHEILHADLPNILFGMSRVAFVENYLKMLYKDPNTGLCRYVEERIPDMTTIDPNVPTVSPPTLNTKVDDIIAKMKSLTTSDMSEVETAINVIRSQSDNSINYGDRMNVEVIVHTLEMLKEYTRNKLWYRSLGVTHPKNLTRMSFGPFFSGVASTLHHDPMNEINFVYALTMMNITLKYMEGTSDFDKNVLMKLKKAKTGLQEMMDTLPTAIHFDCPYGRRLPIAVNILYELGNGYDGEYEESFDQTSSHYCYQQLMAVYMRSGGSRVQSKDIAKTMQAHPIYPISKYCLQHPFDDIGRPIRLSKKKHDGVILLGSPSPLSKTFAWKPIAKCRCDDCMTGYAGHSTPMWTTFGMTHSSTTQGP